MRLAICEKHSLRYDADLASGCVLCRREQAGDTGPTSETGNKRPIGPALLVAAALWIGGGLLLFVAHREVTGAFGPLFGLAATAAPAVAPGFEEAPPVEAGESAPAEPSDLDGDG